MPERPLETASPFDAAALLRRQAQLQAEGRALLATLQLPAALERVGRAELMGSFVTGLMVWRDLDLNVICPRLGLDAALDAVRPLLMHPTVREVSLRKELGRFSFSGQPEDDRYYLRVYLVSADHPGDHAGEAEEAGAGERQERSEDRTWKLDLSFWVADPPRQESLPPEALLRRLTDETRLAILWTKTVWHRLPSYRTTVASVDIYQAVLDHGVRTPDQFAAYLRERSGTPR